MERNRRRISSEAEMIELGEQIAQQLGGGAVFELIGDVGAGKTTFVKGLARGLKIKDPITSPSFTISKRYALPDGGELVHYDFYRLSDPGIMREELAETLANPQNVVVIEWGEEVADLLPQDKKSLKIALCEDSSRQVETNI